MFRRVGILEHIVNNDSETRSRNDVRPAMQLVSNDNSGAPCSGPELDAIRPLPPARAELVELFADFRDAGAVGFALSRIAAGGRVLWVQERMAALETGRPFGQGCEGFGCAMDRLVLACSRNTRDLLWAMEEGLRCSSLSAIVGEAWGNARALDFTASKRLAMRAERQGVPVFLLRYNAARDLSAARQRWNIRSLPSAPHPHDAKAPGAPRWQAELFRARDTRPGQWTVQYDRAAHRLDLVPAFRNPAVAGPAGQRPASAAL